MIDLTGKQYNTRDTIQTIFSPLIGVITSPLADEICKRNSVNFVELLQPFAKLQSDAHFRDIVSGTSVSVRGLRLNFCDVNWRPPQTALARKMLNDSVANATKCDTRTINVDALQLQIPKSELWFESWREIFLTVQFPAEHEFTRHFLGCLIVLASDDPDIVKTAQKITMQVHQMQNIIPQNLPKWFHASSPLNTYVILHETHKGDISRAQQGYELLKSTFGDNKCFLIQMNSIGDEDVTEIPDYWAPFTRKTNKLVSQGDTTDAAKLLQDNIRVPLLESNINESEISKPIFGESDELKLHPLSPVEDHKIDMKPLATESQIKDDNFIMNSEVQGRTIETEVMHGRALNSMDVENIRHFVQDYAVRALIPYVENIVAVLSEAVTNKKGVSKSLLSATKRWFITNKPGTTNVSNQNAVIYTQESVELQTRKLGDLYFMFGHYNLAFQAYHQAKRDFNADSAWQYYAGALEMAALSAFMLGTANRKTYDYMEDAIVCYLNVCKLQQFATRATLLSVECLKVAKLYTEAAKQLTRMTSEESDLRSALLLEQAAYCFLATQPIMFRKYAFHIVLAGNRFTRSGQRKHAYRCYRQAYQIFKEKSWSLADDHIQYTMAKQAMILRNSEDAINSLAYLLRPGSSQNAQQQMNFLREFVQAQNEILKQNPQSNLLQHAVPKIHQNSIRLLLLPYTSTSNIPYVPATHISIDCSFQDEATWRKLEEMLVYTAQSDKPFVFKAQQNIFSRQYPALDHPLAVQNEPIVLSVTFQNPLQCKISLNNIDILWKLKLDNEEEISNVCLYNNSGNSSPEAAITAVVKSHPQAVVLDELSDKSLVFHLTPKVVGSLQLLGVVCQISSTSDPALSLMGMLEFEKQTIKAATKQPSEAVPDKMLSISVLPLLPALNVSFTPTPREVLVGEIIPVTVSLWNSGIMPIEDIYVACDNPRWITWFDKDTDVPLSILTSLSDLSNLKTTKDKEVRRQRVLRLLKSRPDKALKPQESITLPMWIQAPYQKGEFTLRVLFYYGLPSECNSKLKYRLIRQTWCFNVNEGLFTGATCIVSNNEMSLNLSIRNETKAAAAESPSVADLYVNTIGLYSSHHKLVANKTYFTNDIELSEGPLGSRCLGPAKSLNLQCRLENAEPTATLENVQNCLRQRLSFETLMILNNVPQKQNLTPPLEEMFGFLAKNETQFFEMSLSSEDFNSALSRFEPHLTVIVLWVAQVKDSLAAQRIVYGQHFLQLRNLFVETTSPATTSAVLKQPSSPGDNPKDAYPNIIGYSKQLAAANDKYGKYHTITLDKKDANDGNDNNDVSSDDEFPKTNFTYVGRRCLIEDENFLITTKAN